MTTKDAWSAADDERPTRPALPRNTDAPRCLDCGRVYGDHAELFPIDYKSVCLGLRHNFRTEACDDPTR